MIDKVIPMKIWSHPQSCKPHLSKLKYLTYIAYPLLEVELLYMACMCLIMKTFPSLPKLFAAEHLPCDFNIFDSDFKHYFD